jgi:hypothetical protein
MKFLSFLNKKIKNISNFSTEHRQNFLKAITEDFDRILEIVDINSGNVAEKELIFDNESGLFQVDAQFFIESDDNKTCFNTIKNYLAKKQLFSKENEEYDAFSAEQIIDFYETNNVSFYQKKMEQFGGAGVEQPVDFQEEVWGKLILQTNFNINCQQLNCYYFLEDFIQKETKKIMKVYGEKIDKKETQTKVRNELLFKISQEMRVL